MKKGIATIVVVMIATIICSFLILAWQSQLLLAVHRNQAMTDVIATGYAAESEIYDWVAKFLGGYDELFVPPLDETYRILKDDVLLADGTKLNVKANKEGDRENLYINSNRVYASSNFFISRETLVSPGISYDNLDITLSLDCTTSMNLPADAYCKKKCCEGPSNGVTWYEEQCVNNTSQGSGSDGYRECMNRTKREDGLSFCSTRIAETKTAALAFTEAVKDLAGNYPSKTIRLGLNVFRVDAIWKQNLTTNYDQVKDLLNSDLGKWHSGTGGSSMCEFEGSTSIGSGYDLAISTYRPEISPDRKQVVVLVTDGDPNSRHSSYTDTSICGSETCTLCGIYKGLEYMTCSLKKTDEGGIRNPEIDAYAVSVQDVINGGVLDVFQNKDYVKGFYNSGDATDLAKLLMNVLDDITNSMSNIEFGRN